MRVLLTGSAGFVGSHVLRHLLANTDWQIICPVTFRHQGLPGRIESSVCTNPDWAQRVDILHWDLTAPVDSVTRAQLGDIEVIMNVASESHVDRSIATPRVFVENNTSLMLNVLDYARSTSSVRLLLQMSTDEVYGPAYGDHRHKEGEPHRPSNPYAASKAAQENACFAYWRTYGVPVVVTNTMNIIGEMQSPEKFVPMVIRSLRDGRPITVHCAPDGTPGSRHYLHARNLADAWLWLTRYFTEPEGMRPAAYADGALQPSRYHIVGEREINNIDLARMIGRYMGVPNATVTSLLCRESFHASRPGHDLRYALDGSKIAALGWKAPVPLNESLERTVRWTLKHPEWLA